jgi:hypothetical protein
MNDASPKYVVDTCSFTELRRKYPDDIFRGAWDSVSVMADCGLLISSDEVKRELDDQEDIVTDWAQNHPQVFIPLYPEIQLKAAEILELYPNLLDLKNQKSSADAFVIATAIYYNCAVVTEEQSTGHGSKLLKIPNVCKLINVPCVNLLDVFRQEGVKLDISKG